MKVPNLGEAHWGEGAEQSAQVLLGGRAWRAASCEVRGELVGKKGGVEEREVRQRGMRGWRDRGQG